MTTPSQSEVSTKLDAMQWGARILMATSLGSGALLLFMLTGATQPIPMLFGSLHALNFGATMMVAVGGLTSHKAHYDQGCRIEARIERLERRLLAAAGDEVSGQRSRDHHN